MCLWDKKAFLFCFFLNSIGQGLVQTVDLGRDAEVDSSVADFDDEATKDIGIDLVQLDIDL